MRFEGVAPTAHDHNSSAGYYQEPLVRSPMTISGSTL
jgi:hypothetical protein